MEGYNAFINLMTLVFISVFIRHHNVFIYKPLQLEVSYSIVSLFDLLIPGAVSDMGNRDGCPARHLFTGGMGRSQPMLLPTKCRDDFLSFLFYLRKSASVCKECPPSVRCRWTLPDNQVHSLETCLLKGIKCCFENHLYLGKETIFIWYKVCSDAISVLKCFVMPVFMITSSRLWSVL